MNPNNNNQYKANKSEVNQNLHNVKEPVKVQQNIKAAPINPQNQQKPQQTTTTQQQQKPQQQVQVTPPKGQTPPIQSPASTNKKEKSSNVIVIIVFLLIGAFILALPTITSFIQGKINLNPKINDNSNTGLTNGYIQIGKSSNMTISNVKFYNFQKVPNANTITFNYMANKNIEDLKEENLYIELYNNNEKLVYRNKFDVDKINKNVVKEYSMQIDENVFSLVFYAKIIKLTDDQIDKDKEVVYECVYDLIENNVNFLYTIKYYFNNNELIKYDVNKNIIGTEENETLLNGKNILNEEFNLVDDTNVENIVKEDYILSYTIDFNTFDSMDSSFTPLFNINTVKFVIENHYKNSEWNCN